LRKQTEVYNIKKVVELLLDKIILRISEELKIKQEQIAGTVRLLDEDNTVPFIARYRKEITGGLDEVQIQNIAERLEYLRNLQKRKEEVICLIAEQDKLTDELEEKINNAFVLQEVEDLYRPYKQKRKTRASIAKEKGLEPLAQLIWEQNTFTGTLEQYGREYISEEQEIFSLDDVYQGARDIVAEWISDDAEIRKIIRNYAYENAFLESIVRDKSIDKEGKYEQYYEYKESVQKIPPHRIMAVNRGEKEDVLQVKIIVDEEKIYQIIRSVIEKNSKNIFRKELGKALEDAYKRLIAPSIEREIRSSLTEKAEEHAIEVFSRNLKALLLQPPLKDRVVMGIDPGFRTGSKVCVVDKTGKLLDTASIYPHPPQNEKEKAAQIIQALIKKHNVDTIAIGNGTASRETEFFISDLLKNLSGDLKDVLKYTIVDEAGASVYSASALARDEFPDLDVSMRGAVSIARRLQDPLAELVKIEPRSIGVGLYQHDINPKKLEVSLRKVVESAVNFVGVDLNTASVSLLQYVSGINISVAKNIVKYREENGVFRNREELKRVPRLGEKTFIQAAGFLRIPGGDNPLAETPIHPESYQQTERLLKDLGYELEDIRNKNSLKDLSDSLDRLDVLAKAEELNIGVPTLKDIISALKQPGRDPREEFPAPVFRIDVLKMEDLKADMVLKGTVRNVVDFGVFVDIGVEQDGLVHVSEISEEYVENPLDIVQVGDIVNIRILSVDERRKRISLSMKTN
jgi:uncharacterized protein